MGKKQFKPAKSKQVDDFIGGGAVTPERKTEVRRVGRPTVATEPTKKLNALLPESLFKTFKADCAINDTTMTDVIIKFLQKKYK